MTERLVTFAEFDVVQQMASGLDDEIKRLKARVTALEGGKALPPDQVIEHAPHTPVPVQISAPEPAPTSSEPAPLPDISEGWVGGQRGGTRG